MPDKHFEAKYISFLSAFKLEFKEIALNSLGI